MRSCTRQAAGFSRPCRPRAQRASVASARPWPATAAGCCGTARRRSRRSLAMGSTARPSWHPCARSPAEGGVPTFLGAHAVPPEHDSADEYLDWLIAEVLPEAATIAEAADVFLERGAFDAVQARPLSRGRARPRARATAARRPVHGGGRDPPRDRAGRPLGRPSGGDGTRRRACAGGERRRRACCCPRARSSSAARCRQPARSSTQAPQSHLQRTSTRAARSARACRSSARSHARSSGFRLRRHSRPAPSNAAHVLGRADSKGRLAPGFDADIVLLDAPDWRYLAYHLGGDVVSEVIVGGTALG